MPLPSSTCPFHEVLFSNFATATTFLSVAAWVVAASSSAVRVGPQYLPKDSLPETCARIGFLLITSLPPSPPRDCSTRGAFSISNYGPPTGYRGVQQPDNKNFSTICVARKTSSNSTNSSTV